MKGMGTDDDALVRRSVPLPSHLVDDPAESDRDEEGSSGCTPAPNTRWRSSRRTGQSTARTCRDGWRARRAATTSRSWSRSSVESLYHTRVRVTMAGRSDCRSLATTLLRRSLDRRLGFAAGAVGAGAALAADAGRDAFARVTAVVSATRRGVRDGEGGTDDLADMHAHPVDLLQVQPSRSPDEHGFEKKRSVSLERPCGEWKRGTYGAVAFAYRSVVELDVWTSTSRHIFKTWTLIDTRCMEREGGGEGRKGGEEGLAIDLRPLCRRQPRRLDAVTGSPQPTRGGRYIMTPSHDPVSDLRARSAPRLSSRLAELNLGACSIRACPGRGNATRRCFAIHTQESRECCFEYRRCFRRRRAGSSVVGVMNAQQSSEVHSRDNDLLDPSVKLSVSRVRLALSCPAAAGATRHDTACPAVVPSRSTAFEKG